MYYTMYLMHKKIFDVLSFGGYISVNLQDIMFACLLLSSKNMKRQASKTGAIISARIWDQ